MFGAPMVAFGIISTAIGSSSYGKRDRALRRQRALRVELGGVTL
jgi:hypothetical protein